MIACRPNSGAGWGPRGQAARVWQRRVSVWIVGRSILRHCCDVILVHGVIPLLRRLARQVRRTIRMRYSRVKYETPMMSFDRRPRRTGSERASAKFRPWGLADIETIGAA